MRILKIRGVFCLLALSLHAVSGHGESVTIGTERDCTLYEDGSGSLANGLGQFFFTGNNGFTGGNRIVRGLVYFDVAASVSAGSTITSAVLTLTHSSPNITPRSGTVNLHKTLKHWGEGISVALGGGGGGAASATNDATWIHTFFNTSFWASAGGDFSNMVSGSTFVNGNGTYTWSSTQTVTDVQSWLDSPSDNFGWLIKQTAEGGTAIRFNSEQNANIATRPQLTIGFAPPVADLKLFKTDAPDPVVGANALAYTLTVTNCGPGDARNVTITDTLPAGVTPAGPIVTNIGTLGPGAGASITIIVQVNTNTTGAITNQAVVSTSDTDPNPANDTAQADTTIPDFDSDGDPDFHDPDDDNDGIPDVFEENFGLDPNNAADAGLDPDMDGFTSLAEFIADTDPTNGMSFFRIDKLGITNSVIIFFDSSTGRIYTLEFIDDLVNGFFTNFPEHTDIPGAGDADSFTDTNEMPRRFYQIEVELP